MERLDEMKSKASHTMDALFRTGYPHPINLFATLMLTVIPLLSPWAGGRFPTLQNGLAGIVALLFLLGWSRIRVFHPNRAPRFFWVYLLTQTALVSLIYVLDGGLTRFLFVVVAVQAIYLSPVRRWAWYVGTLVVLWLTLYFAISPDPGESMVATIGMYLSYLLFAAFVTFTAVQQERQNRLAQELLDSVDQRHHTLRAYEQRVGHRAEEEERERLAQTICTTLLIRLTRLMEQLQGLELTELNRQTARDARLEAKDVLAEVRQVVRTLRPAEGLDLEEADEPDRHAPPPEPMADTYLWTDPVRVYHVWNVLVMILVVGVMVASALVGGSPRWWHLLLAGFCMLGTYGAGIAFRQPWNRTLALVTQCALIVWLVVIAQEPLVNHLFLIVAAQIVFLVPVVTRWLASAVVFPTLLSGVSLWLTNLFVDRPSLLVTLTAAFGITNFFGAVMAFMTRRQVEDRQRAVIYAEQLATVNRLLEARLHDLRRLAIARERVRMAREIHDGLGHHLTIVIMELQYAEQLAGEDPAGARQHIAGARQVIITAMNVARELVENLERFERPLPEALVDLVAAWRKGNGGVDVVTRIYGDFSGLSTAARVTMYRAVQESLTNIQKHTRAERVEIDLYQLPDRVTLLVTNDDRGGAPHFEAGRSGFGLLGLKERADALQGEFKAGPRAGGGFQVRLVLPLGA